MELKRLKTESKELIMNSLSIYYALQNQSKIYRNDAMASLSLYAGALRLGQTVTITREEPIRTSPGAGYPYPDGIKPSTINEKPEYERKQYNYENIVCQILNKYGVTIEQVIAMLNLDEKLTIPARSSINDKIERQYNAVYQRLLQTIRNCYVASAKQANEENRNCNPLIEMDIPTIISALHYPNIDLSNSIMNAYAKLKGMQSPLTSMPDYLDEIEKHVTYEEELCKSNAAGQLKLYRVRKPLVMNENIGKII